tara:strand:- start:31 stop:897 length:867 start_codon:yes stop_codon:yes gene_type:complete
MSKKPTVFIASSSEALPVAEAVLVKLEQEVRVKSWDNAFDLSNTTINTLVQKTKEVDYAVFVFSKDDTSIIRGEEYASTRDNVVLELGLFIGALGLERCFILAPKSVSSSFRLPTDLAGVTASFYDDDEELEVIDAITSSCVKVKQAIARLEKTPDSTETSSKDEILNRQLHEAQSQIWRMNHDIQREAEKSQTLLEAIKHYFFSVAKPATPAEIKAWETGAKQNYLQEVKIRDMSVYYVDRDTIVPPLHGASSLSIIVAEGVKVYGLDRWSHNKIYYMDGFRSDSRF